MVEPGGKHFTRAKYHKEDLIVTEIDLTKVKRERIYSPAFRDEKLELVIQELDRIVADRGEG